VRFRQNVQNGVAFIALVALLLVPLALTNQRTSMAWAQMPDPPARVGRLNYITGPVSFAPGGLNQWARATLNYPLTTGTALWTDEGGRAELHIGSTAVRMDQFTQVDILNLDDQTTQLRVAQGTVDIGLHQLAADERFEVATPTASIMLVRPGRYRFEADADGVRVTVWTGRVDVATSTHVFSVYPVQTVLVSNGGSQIVATPALDEFGQWALGREAREEQALLVASQYVPPAMTGYEDLVHHGTWRTVGGYGAVWFPTVQPGWAPYRHGQWVWISPWGWTWVDSAPWGFAPFHYGRWVLIGAVWAWVPGPVFVRPVFAPALVVFLVIGNTIGWFPLALHEVYVPSYYCSPAYYRRININIVNIDITNINVTNIKYVFRHSPKAITLVGHGAFVQAGSVATSIVSAPKADIDGATVTASAPLRPDVRSLLGHPQGTAGSHKPPTVVEQRPVVVRQAPPAPPRPEVIGVQAPVRNIPVKPAAEPGRVRTTPRPAPMQTAAPVQPQPVVPAPNAAQPRPIVASPNPAPPGQVVPSPNPAQPGVPTPHPVLPAVPGPNPVPAPHSERPLAPVPRPDAPTPHPQQPAAPAPHPQPGGLAPRPAPTPPQVVPMPSQNRPTPQPPRNQIRAPVCDERSPNHDPRVCPQHKPKRR